MCNWTRYFRWFSKILSLVLFLGLVTCAKPNHPTGLHKSGGGNGPRIVFDPLAKPVPDIPFPNDLGTILDNTSLTGRRVNLPLDAPTQLEQRIRVQLNGMDGFGTFAPMTVRFDAPVDIRTISDASVLVIKLVGPNAGKIVPIDLGKGFFPTISTPHSYWPHDPLANANNILIDPNNMADLNGDTVAEFVDFYEAETNTLLIHPIIPLDEMSRYAVVILNSMRGFTGESVRSPFAYINHSLQNNDLAPLPGLLALYGIPIDQVAFTWSFTTQSITPDWLNFWYGLHDGVGVLGYLATDFPPVMKPVNLQIAADMDGNWYTLRADWFNPLLNFLLPLIGDASLGSAMDFTYVDYLIFGTFKSPTFFYSQNFGNPLITPEIFFDPAKLQGAGKADSLTSTFIISVPKDEDLGLDGCQSSSHPFGCMDAQEPGAKGPDNCWGICGIDSNNDGLLNDAGEYLTPGSDDVPDPSCDNYYPDLSKIPAHCTCYDPGTGTLTPNWDTGECTMTQGNGILDSHFAPGLGRMLTEDANGNGRLDTPPFPVVVYGHGLTMAATESLAFVGPMARFGLAVAAMDAFGHGPLDSLARLDQVVRDILVQNGVNLQEVCVAGNLSGTCNIMVSLLTIMGADLNGDGAINGNDVGGLSIDQVIEQVFTLGLFRVISKQGRAFDIDGDGYTDSGRVFFNGNIFQTRDAIRQTEIDYMQLTRILDHFGQQATNDLNGDTIPDMDGDFNLDGRVDLGGPGAKLYWVGSSLGGINGLMNMAVNPRIKVGAPVSGAGGLTNVIYRSNEGNATEPALRQAMGPIVVGTVNANNLDDLTFNADPLSTAFASLYVPPYGIVRVTNLNNTKVAYVFGDDKGNFAVGIPADVGDVLEIVSLNIAGGLVSPVVYAVSKYHGLGLKRNSPDFRRFIGLGQWAVERGDPINFAGHYFTNPNGSPLPGYPEKSILVINTTGDATVPIATGTAIAAVASLWTLDEAQWLINKGLNFGYIPTSGYPSPIYDADDVDGDNSNGCGFPPADPRCTSSPPFPMPLTPVPVAGGPTVSTMRLHYVNEKGHHAFALPGTVNHGIEWGVYMVNQIGYYFATDGRCVIDDPYELHASPYISPGPDGILQTPALGDDVIRTVRVLSTLGVNDCNYPFPTMQIITAGPDNVINSTQQGDDVLVNYSNLYRGP